LLHHIGVQDDRVAVELDRQIVRRSEWETTQIRAGASIEIVQFVGGG
jgi:thiamine biosynthesis protein ThiS